MQLFDVPLTTLILILFGMLSLFTLVMSIRMPSNFEKEEKIRSELKKRVYISKEPQATEGDQVI